MKYKATIRPLRASAAPTESARTGVLTMRMPSLAKTASKSRVNVLSRSRIRKRNRPGLPMQRPGELTRLLCNPGASRVGGAAGEVNAAVCEFDEEEDIEALQGDRLEGEEIDGEHALRLLPQERTPCETAATAGRAEACFAEDLPYRRCGHA
jgi:hypothetical protein